MARSGFHETNKFIYELQRNHNQWWFNDVKKYLSSWAVRYKLIDNLLHRNVLLQSKISNKKHTFWKTQRAIKRIKWHVVMTSTSLRIGNIFILQLCFKPLHINLIYNYLQMCLMICFYKNLTISIWFTQNHMHISFWHKKLAMVLTDSSTHNNLATTYKNNTDHHQFTFH